MSAAKDLTPLGMEKEDLNLLRYYQIDHIKFDCAPLVYRTIIQWGFALPEGKKIIDHIKYLDFVTKFRAKCDVDLKKWMKKNESQITRDTFSDFDITALHDFLPILCYDKIAQTGSQEYEEQTKDPNSVESLLKVIKAFIDDVSHKYAESVKHSHIDNMKDTMIKCIRAAGKLYGKGLTVINEKVKDLDDEIVKVIRNPTHLYENRVKYIAQKISSEVPSNMLERYSQYFSVHIPCSSKKIDTSDIFYYSNLSVATKDIEGKEDEHYKTVFPCTETYNKTHEKFMVIYGGPGSGKTTLMRNLVEDILHTTVHGGKPRYEKIEQFKIPIYLECRSEQQTNFAKFLKESLKIFFSHEDDIKEAFKSVKGTVFLIDGYDEINKNCQLLVDSIIDFCKDNSASCIVSSRVDVWHNFVYELKRKNLNCAKIFIEPISEMSEKVNILRSYAVKINASIDFDKLAKSFQNLPETAQEIFSSPIHIALFIFLFVHELDSVSQMENEQSTYEAFRTSFLCELMEKLKDAHNPRGIAGNIVGILGKFCLKFFWANNYFLEAEDYYRIVAECQKISGMPDDIDIPNLLSCILTPEHSFNFNHGTTYQFMHRTIQEFFAAKYVSFKLSSQRQSKVRQLRKLHQAMGLHESQSGIKYEMIRYGNIIKHLMLESLANGDLPEYRDTYTQLLSEYFVPEGYNYCSPVYHLDLILSSDSNEEIISIVSDCMRRFEKYNIEYNRHIKPMTEVFQTLKTKVVIDFSFYEVVNAQQLIKLLTVLENDCEIKLDLHQSYDNSQPIEGELYKQLNNSKCKVTGFKACVTSEEHLFIVARVLKIPSLFIRTPSVSDISFEALEEYKGSFNLKVKYSEYCPSTGSNPLCEGAYISIEDIPADGKEIVYKTIKYISPKSKKFSSIELGHCRLTDTDANKLLKQLHRDKIRTWGRGKIEVNKWRRVIVS